MGYMRMRRSVSLGPGVRLNLSKSGLGASFGTTGLRYSIGPTGRRTRTIGIPGTGVGYVETLSSGSRRGSSSTRARKAAIPQAMQEASPAAFVPKPGWFASAAEKRYREGVIAYLTGDKPAAAAAFEAVLAADPHVGSAHFIAALSLPDSEASRAIAHLEAVVTGHEPLPDALQAKYLPAHVFGLSIALHITEYVTVQGPFDTLGATLTLAEAYQEAGRLEEAIGLVQQLHADAPTAPPILLSLADLLYADNDLDGVLEVTDGVTNDGDLSVEMLHLRAAALFAQGHTDASLQVFREALSKTANRNPDLLKIVRYDRALAFEMAGQKARARADWERLYAADRSFRDVAERVAGGPEGTDDG